MSHIFKLVRDIAPLVDGVNKSEVFYVAAESFGNASQSPANLANRSEMESRDDLHNFEKNLDQNGLLWKKLEHFEIGRRTI